MSSPYQPPTEFSSPPPRRVWPFVLTGCAVVGVLLIAACAGLIYFGFRQVTGGGEVAVEVDRLFEEIAQGRAADFYRNESTDGLKRATSEVEFVDFAQSINEHLGKLQSKTATGVSVNSQNLATYVEAVYDCQFERGKATVKTRFRHENGKWLLQAFHVESPELLKHIARKKCPNCGGLYEPGAKFCPHCGAKLAEDDAGEDRDSKSDASPENP
jgi:ribosomal protein S27AE